jgi:hypothetical protein
MRPARHRANDSLTEGLSVVRVSEEWTIPNFFTELRLRAYGVLYAKLTPRHAHHWVG